METLKLTVVRFISTLKQFFKMGLNTKGKVITGKEAQQKIIKTQKVEAGLTEKEINFILSKLRQANYTGAEFEFFYIVYQKLQNLLPKK